VFLKDVTRRTLDTMAWEKMDRATERMRGWTPISIIDNPHQTITQIRSLAREQARKPEGLDCIVIDYLGLIEKTDPRMEERAHVSMMSRAIKVLAKELHIPVIALHQLNRETEKRQGKRPQLSDFRESGSVEQDCDIAILLHRDFDDETRLGEIDMILAKQRQGPTACVTCAWMGEYARIGSMARGDQHW
jgi:replicative DNA helicase